MANVHDTIAELRKDNEEMSKFLVAIQEMPHAAGVVAAITKNKVVVVVDGKISEVEKTAAVKSVGQSVAIIPNTGQIVDNFCVEVGGDIASYVERIDDTQAIISMNGKTSVAFCSLEADEGDRLIVNGSGAVVMKNLGGASEKSVDDEVCVQWEDIAGLPEVKAELMEIIETPHTMKEVYAAYGYSTPKGLLLLGPPGCGKTLVGKAAATSMKKIFGGKSSFIYVKGPELLNKFVGQSEENIRNVFARARRHYEKNKTPAVIFIDEAESILSTRGAEISSAVDKTIVPSFLTEMDGMNASGALVILATNRPDMLDPAIVRDGRIDRKFSIGRPGKKEVAEIAEINTRGIKKDFTGKDVAESVFDAGRVVFHAIGTGHSTPITMGDLVSGAMIAGAVNRAKGFAVRRDVKNKAKQASGVTMNDINEALAVVTNELSLTSHDDTVKEICRARGFECTSYA